VFWGVPLAEVLRAHGIQPDFEADFGGAEASLDYIHRRSGQTEIFFVANQLDRPQEARCTFRVRARRPELWDPLTGETRTAAAFVQTDDGRMKVPLELPPHGSVFVLFRQPIGPAQKGTGNRLWLDLGEVRELAQVGLNGKDLGVVWTKPFRMEVTKAAQAGVNRLEVDVVNLWPNRLIGDQSLPETQRFTKTNVKKFRNDSPLSRSGLLGPVTILAGKLE